MNAQAMLAPLRERWRTLAPRERTLVGLALGVMALALLWWIGVAPALKILGQSEVRHRSLDGQWQRMQSLASEAQALQSRPKARYDDALRALEASVKQGLGPGAQLTVSGERATITLKGVSANSLATWLAQARTNARALPAEARLARSPASTASSGTLWDGTLVVNLPPR